MLKFVLLILAVLAVLLGIIISLQPDNFRITRSTTLAASPSAVYGQVNDLHKWNEWSPWAKLDPNCKVSFDGPPAGVGAGFAWAGNKEVGEGRMTITECKANEVVVMRLEFVKPFAGTNTTEFTFKPSGAGTAVTWTMSGKNNFMAKAVGLVMNCDKMVGGQFEKGFENLKAVVEPAAKK